MANTATATTKAKIPMKPTVVKSGCAINAMLHRSGV